MSLLIVITENKINEFLLNRPYEDNENIKIADVNAISLNQISKIL